MSISADGEWHTATLGLGGNIGDPVRAMGQALRILDGDRDCRVEAVSKLYRTPPWGMTEQADFYNSCALIRTRLGPHALLDRCLGIEREMKRVRIERWGPRTIDIDVLTYDDLNIATETLSIPHPRMTERAFVLMPLADIAADIVVKGRRVSEWLTSTDISGIVIADAGNDWWRHD